MGAADAQRTIDGMHQPAVYLTHAMNTLLADSYALHAMGTEIFVIHQLYTCCMRLGIMTPKTRERAPFEKNGGPDTRPVIDGEALDVKYRCIGVNNWFCHKFPVAHLSSG